MKLSQEEKRILRERLLSEKQRRGIELDKDFAVLLGITPTYWGFIQSGKRAGGGKIPQFARRLNVSIPYLLGHDDLSLSQSTGIMAMLRELIATQEPEIKPLSEMIVTNIKEAYRQLMKLKRLEIPAAAMVISLIPYLHLKYCL